MPFVSKTHETVAIIGFQWPYSHIKKRRSHCELQLSRHGGYPLKCKMASMDAEYVDTNCRHHKARENEMDIQNWYMVRIREVMNFLFLNSVLKAQHFQHSNFVHQECKLAVFINTVFTQCLSPRFIS
jgi:hypothetical protein